MCEPHVLCAEKEGGRVCLREINACSQGRHVLQFIDPGVVEIKLFSFLFIFEMDSFVLPSGGCL